LSFIEKKNHRALLNSLAEVFLNQFNGLTSVPLLDF